MRILRTIRVQDIVRHLELNHVAKIFISRCREFFLNHMFKVFVGVIYFPEMMRYLVVRRLLIRAGVTELDAISLHTKSVAPRILKM